MKLSSPIPLDNEASTTPVIFVVIVPPLVYAGVKTMSSIPEADSMLMMKILTGYGVAWITYGRRSLARKEGMTSQRRTTPLGTEGPTKSRAAERIIT